MEDFRNKIKKFAPFRAAIAFYVQAPKPGALPTGPHPEILFDYGQICGQRNSITESRNFQEGKRAEFKEKIKKFAPL